jgi:hypothetical protein
MSNQVFPADVRGLKFGSTKAPMFNTLVQKAPNFFSTRILQSQNPIWKWSLIYDYLYQTADGQYNNALLSGRTYPDWQLLLGFIMGRQGQFDDFLYRDPNDYAVGPALVSAAPNLQAQLSLVTDGTTFYSPIQRNMGGQFAEDITDLKAGTLSVYADGILQTLTTDYLVKGPGLGIPGASYGGMYLQWTSEPLEPVTAQFEFYFRVCFLNDSQEFENFLQYLWSLGGHGGNQLELISSRPVIACE